MLERYAVKYQRWAGIIAVVVCLGATGARGADKDPAAKEHWAFKSPEEPRVPEVKTAERVKSPVDSFILAKLEEKGLGLSFPADKRTLIRRAYFDLIGLPPTPNEVAAFEADSSTDAFEKVVDHLLASPRYGERWGRYWLDVARYSDTKGYVFQEERKYPYAYTYRDWVVRAINDDLPYDQFLIQQIAADQLDLGDDKRPLAAMGFLTVGRRFLNNKPDVIDDRLDVVCRGTMAITIGCARCHDHKFDPIPTKDYYSLYSVFNNSIEPADLPLIGKTENIAAFEAFEKEVAKRQADYDTYTHDRLAEFSADLRTPKKIADYMVAALQPAVGRQQQQQTALDKLDLNAVILGQWRSYLLRKGRENDSIFAAWRLYAAIPADQFADKAAEVAEKMAAADAQHPLHALVAKEFADNPPKALRDVADRYAALLAKFDKPAALPDVQEESLRLVLNGDDSPLKLPAGTDAEKILRRDFRDKAMALRKKIDEFKANSPAAPPRAMVMADAKNIEGQRVFVRGNQGNPGDAVKPHFLTCLAGPEAPTFSHGSGRLEFAQAIASKDNPLTARVMVNRVWLHHFGQGLVRTPSDFGTRSDPPTHPELLDYLALRFMEDGWSLKKLHRRLMLSATYQQSSDATPQAQQIDSENLLLSHMNRQRLDFEAMHDSMVFVSGQLDTTAGGRPVDITVDPSPARRAIYTFIDRQNLPGLFRNFDFASPDATSPRRFSTTVPQQALFMLNSPFMLQQVRGLLTRPEVAAEQSNDSKVTQLYRILFDRAPNSDEIELGRGFIEAETGAYEAPTWQYGYGEYDSQTQHLKNFTPLPHFTGKAYQGGATLPDATTGWVTLLADGGHPGNDRQHAAVRRWTSPIDGIVRITGTLSHKETQGDGVHAVITGSRAGELATWNVFHNEAETSVGGIGVKKGDTIDFIVDCRNGPAYDSFAWSPVIRAAGAANGGPALSSSNGPVLSAPNGPLRQAQDMADQWSAAANFSAPRKSKVLSPWEKYAQVLMGSNEFMFAD